MKFLTIRMRVTLWYAFFMLVLLAISLALISNLSAKAMLANQQENLIETVSDGIDEIDSPGNFDFFENGVYLLVYDERENYLGGVMPADFTAAVPFADQVLQTARVEDQAFYLYDKLFFWQGKPYWLRGIAPQSGPDPIGAFMVTLVSGVLPVFVLLTCAVGYFITKRALAPVKKIQETAQTITDRNELSLRIGLSEGKDEIARLAQTVDNMLDKLEKSFAKEKQFTADASHELRTPLAVILSESEYALQHAKSLGEAKESMAVINRQAERMSALINQLLFFTRSDREALVLNEESFRVDLAVMELAEDYREPARAKEMTITTAIKTGSRVMLRADRMLFCRSLSNLIQNAVQYGNPGGRIEVSVYWEKKGLAVAVSDDGIGIAAQDLDRIWDRFYQVKQSRSKENGGSMGLGLSMVKAIVNKHGGSVAVDSQPDEGSTFTLYFPQ